MSKAAFSAISGYFHLIDRWLLLLWAGASALSAVFQYGLYRAGMISSTKEMRMMIISSSLGLAAAVVISLLDYHFILKLWKLYLPACLLLVGLTFFSPLASLVGDNQAWLILPIGNGVSVQPSEFLKLCFITTFSLHLSTVKDRLNRLPTLLLLCLHGFGHVVLIQLQGDTGSALIFLAIFLVMLFCAGVNWRYIGAAAAAIGAMAPLLWFRLLSDDQKMRILILFHPDLDPDYAYQQQKALHALVYGGLRGNGIINDSYRFVWVPKAYNDLIFSFIGEACGLVGCLGVILLLAAIAFKILFNSHLALDPAGQYICIGVFAMITAQVIINLGMCLGLMPVIGVTLPLFSAGGSSVLSLYLGLGLALSVYSHSRRSLFSGREP